MDFAETFDAPVIETVGGTEVSFPVIPVMVMAQTLAATAKKRKKDKAKETIQEFGLQGNEKLILAKDASSFYLDDLQDYVATPEGSIDAIKVSLGEVGKKAKEEIDEILSRMSTTLVNRVALLVTQFYTVVDKEEKQDNTTDKEKESVLPLVAKKDEKKEEMNGYDRP